MCVLCGCVCLSDCHIACPCACATDGAGWCVPVCYGVRACVSGVGVGGSGEGARGRMGSNGILLMREGVGAGLTCGRGLLAL